jgi:hypothetical protein
MSDIVIIDLDTLQFLPQFGNRLVTPLGPAQIRGNGQATINGRKVCISGDENRVRIRAAYTTPTHTIPGTGVITIASLGSHQLARHVSSDEALIIQGTQFTARFQPETPAQMPPPANTPDPTAPSDGQGLFIPSQFVVKAS